MVAIYHPLINLTGFLLVCLAVVFLPRFLIKYARFYLRKNLDVYRCITTYGRMQKSELQRIYVSITRRSIVGIHISYKEIMCLTIGLNPLLHRLYLD